MARNHAQCGCLAAAGRPEQATIGARWNLEVDGIHSGYAAVPLRKLHQFKRRRGRHPHQSAFVLSWALGTLAPQPGRFHATHVPKKGANPRLFDELTRCSSNNRRSEEHTSETPVTLEYRMPSSA